MPQIVEMILFYIPITLIACIVYASIKRNSLREITLAGLNYFLMFTGLILACIVVLEAIQWIGG